MNEAPLYRCCIVSPDTRGVGVSYERGTPVQTPGEWVFLMSEVPLYRHQGGGHERGNPIQVLHRVEVTGSMCVSLGEYGGVCFARLNPEPPNPKPLNHKPPRYRYIYIYIYIYITYLRGGSAARGSTPPPLIPTALTPNPLIPNLLIPNPNTPNPLVPNPLTQTPLTPNPVTPNPPTSEPEDGACSCSRVQGLTGVLAHKRNPPPQDHHRSLSIGLL
jgi:hypothetical protein